MEKRLLVALNFTEVAAEVVKIADEWAQRNQAELHFLHVKPAATKEYDAGFPAFEEWFENYAKEHNLRSNYTLHLSFGTPYIKILELSQRMKADLIIMAAHSHTMLGRMFLGGNTDYVVHHCDCPVYVYRQSETDLSQDIIVPIDYSEINKAVVGLADTWTQRTGGELHLIHASTIPETTYSHETSLPPGGYDMNWDEIYQRFNETKISSLHRTFEKYVASLNIKSKHQLNLEFDKPYFKIEQLQQKTKAGLIMMAAHSHTLLNRIFVGSNTDYLLHHVKCPMYVYKEQKS